VKIVTYNLRFGSAGRNHWPKVLEELDPDIFLTQESYPPNQHLAPLLDAGLHCHASWSPVGKQHWGSAVYVKGHRPSRLDLRNVEGHVVGVEVPEFAWPDPEGCRLRVFSVHAPDTGDYYRAVHSVLDQIAEVRDDCDLVIGGDFLSTERHESEPRQTGEVDLTIQARLRDEFGLIDCWQTAHPRQPLATKPAPYHGDGIYIPASWQERLQKCVVMSDDEWDKMSDHCPVMAEFQ
jgi:exonuclease III